MADERVNILIVDDLPEKLLVLETVLAELEQNIITVRSGEEALRQVLNHHFAVILLDVNMPGMSGLETAALIRRRKKSAHVPIIFITAFADEMHTAEGYALGAVDYILSPIVPAILRTKVKVFVDLFRMNEQMRQQAEERIALIREQAARSAAEETTRRSAFLAEASMALTSALEFEATVRALARVVVPFLADLGAVTLTDEAGQPLPAVVSDPWPVESNRFPPALQAAIRRVIADGQTTVVRSDGGWQLADGGLMSEAVVLPLRGRGKMIGALTLALGPSERRFSPTDLALAEDFAGRAAVALDNARLYQDLQEADRRKNEFLSMLAHELRNPLAPIRNSVSVLRTQALASIADSSSLSADDQVQATMDWALDVIDRQVQHLVRLVDDLLDISRITRGKIQLHLEPVEVSTFVSRAVETSQPLIDARRHQLVVNLPEGPLLVKGDLTRLSQVLSNLLNNAAKYTHEEGKIWLTAARANGQAEVRVRDTGVGIPQHMLQSVFDLFTQVDRSLDRSEGGLGLGLTLVRRLVEMHGGKVQAFSRGPNEGSEFVIRLPLLGEAASGGSEPSVEVTAGEPCSSPAPPAVARKVLVVDDSQDAADSMAMLLRLGGHEVEIALDGVAALERARTFQPDVVLLDIGLPGMDGYEVARRLRQVPESNGTLLIALTGYGQEEDRRRSQEAGFDYHLVKPVDVQKLLNLLTSQRGNRDE